MVIRLIVGGLLTACWLALALAVAGGQESAPSAAQPAAAAEVATGPESGADAFHCSLGSVDWSKVPPVRPTPRMGMYFISTGPGYYSLAEQVQSNYRDKAPTWPWGFFSFTPSSAFDLDFRYLDKPDNTEHDCFDPLKRIHCGDDWLLSVGGQSWLRTMHEVDSRLTTVNNDYQLVRSRLYTDLWFRDQFRIYAEYLYAEAFHSDLPPLPIDINRSDLLNLFADLKVGSGENGPTYLRVGRQELLYGSQRLISPLEWGNTRRSFQGVKGLHIGQDWDLDLFWVQPVRVAKGDFDSVDNNRNFAGAWATRKLRPGTGRDFYYLYLDDTNPVAVGRGGALGGQYLHTLGTHWYGQKENWLYELELMIQLGSFSNQDQVAASIPVGGGYFFRDAPAKPQVWLYYDWASGDKNPGQGDTHTTFNQLFPFGHYYYGYLDLVGRQNIHDVYTQLVFFPENWITCLVQFHNFWLAQSRDALYNAAGVPLRVDPTGQAGNFVGNEIDLLLSCQLSRHANFAVGCSKLFAGEFIQGTGPDVSPELLYLQVNYRW